VNRRKISRTKQFVEIAATLALVAATKLQATTIAIDLGPPMIYTGTNAQVGPIAFSNLNGVLVNGSSVSLDFVFTSQEFVELFSNTSPSFDVSVTLLTNAGTSPGLVTNTSAYLVDQNGNALPGPGIIGTAQSSNGSTSVGFFPLLDSNGGPNPNLTFPFSFYGVHFGFTLPNDRSASVIGADFALFGNGGPDSQFAVGPHVPDNGDAGLLLVIAVGGLLAAKLRIGKTV